MLDKIYIKQLHVRGHIGFQPWEKEKHQDIYVHYEIETDTKKAAASDKPEDALDYKAINKSIIDLVENNAFNLIETLAEKIAALILQDKRIIKTCVKVEKPDALRFTKTVGVEITREQHV